MRRPRGGVSGTADTAGDPADYELPKQIRFRDSPLTQAAPPARELDNEDVSDEKEALESAETAWHAAALLD